MNRVVAPIHWLALFRPTVRWRRQIREPTFDIFLGRAG